MRILVLSDSHRAMSFMEQCAEITKPDCIVHLGDYYPDGFELKHSFPKVEFYQVPGNCDAYTCRDDLPLILMPRLGGCYVYMTHGHRHNVKLTLFPLLRDARAEGAQVALYGHSHIPDCHFEDDGLLVMNPGSAGYGQTAGWLEIENGIVKDSRIIGSADLEEWK